MKQNSLQEEIRTEISREDKLEEANDSKKRWGKRILLIVILVLAVLTMAAVWYFRKVNYYRTHYFPNTYVNGMHFGDMTAEDVEEMLQSEVETYELRIMGRDASGKKQELGRLTAAQIGLASDKGGSAALDVLEQQKEFQWMKALGGKEYSYSVAAEVSFEKDMLEQALLSLAAFQKENMIAPEDASIGEYSEVTGTYDLLPEIMGTELNVEKAVSAVTSAVLAHQTEVDLVTAECYREPEVTSGNQELQVTLDTLNIWLGTKITYDWNGAEVVVDSRVIKEWVSIENQKPVLDEEAVKEFVSGQAQEYDTYGKHRAFRTTTGLDLTLPSGAFGWRTDREQEAAALVALIRKGAVLEREPVYNHTAPKKGRNDIGNSYVEADLTGQHLYLYHQGNLVLETDFVSGIMTDPGCVTPQGVFGLTYKTTNAVLRGADYETPVSYWMPFHGNFGMHDATWRNAFGGDIYLTNGSHGCLNLPLDKAAVIYDYLYTGYPVICYYVPTPAGEAQVW